MNKKALFYSEEDGSAACRLCFHNCRIKRGKRGLCGVREYQQELASLNYGRLVAASPDPVEKKPLYHFYPGTCAYSIAAAGCNFKCRFCQNWHISQAKGREKELLGVPEVAPAETINAALYYKCASLAYTYTEPTVFIEYVLDTAALAKKYGMRNVFITNGFMQKEPLRELLNCIDAFNVDLKSFSDEFYDSVCGAGKEGLKRVLDNISAIKSKGAWLEITTLFIPSLNDSRRQMRQIAEFIARLDKDIPWHISAFYPSYKMDNFMPTPGRILEEAFAVGKEAGLKYIYIGNIVTKSGSNTYCPSCGRMLIQRDGFRVHGNFIKEGKCPSCGREIAGRF